MTAAVRIRSDMASMGPPAVVLSVALSSKSDSHRSHLHTVMAVTRIEHRQQLVRYCFGMAVQPATEDMFLTLAASSGATENAWLSDTGP